MKHNFFLVLLTFIFFSVLLWSVIHPKDYFTWFLEVFPSLIAFGIILYTYRSFPLTPIAYVLVLIHSIILMVGGHYTYAEVPLFDWVKEVFHQDRNNYDKVGHFAQGFIPAIISRELLIRKNVVCQKGWLHFICVCICMAISAFYELLEWWVATLSGEGADAFLGTQGYIWDTQSDMFLATIGAISALVILGKWHDKQIAQLNSAL